MSRDLSPGLDDPAPVVKPKDSVKENGGHFLGLCLHYKHFSPSAGYPFVMWTRGPYVTIHLPGDNLASWSPAVTDGRALQGKISVWDFLPPHGDTLIDTHISLQTASPR